MRHNKYLDSNLCNFMEDLALSASTVVTDIIVLGRGRLAPAPLVSIMFDVSPPVSAINLSPATQSEPRRGK